MTGTPVAKARRIAQRAFEAEREGRAARTTRAIKQWSRLPHKSEREEVINNLVAAAESSTDEALCDALLAAADVLDLLL